MLAILVLIGGIMLLSISPIAGVIAIIIALNMDF